MSDNPAGLAASVRGLGAHLVAMAQVRLELLVIEITEERARLSRLLLSAVLAFFFLGFGALALAMLLTVLWWDTQRYLALAVLCAFFLGAGCVCLVAVLRIRGDGSRLFAASLAELVRDRDALDKKS